MDAAALQPAFDTFGGAAEVHVTPLTPLTRLSWKNISGRSGLMKDMIRPNRRISDTPRYEQLVRSSDWELVFEDGFGPGECHGGRLRSSEWQYSEGYKRNNGLQFSSMNNEAQYYAPENVRCANGLLNLSVLRVDPSHPPQRGGARVNYTCASVRTQKSWTYGRFEMRAKIDVAKGSWPTWWAGSESDVKWPAAGEIDMMEFYDNQSMAWVMHSSRRHKHWTPDWWGTSVDIVNRPPPESRTMCEDGAKCDDQCSDLPAKALSAGESAEEQRQHCEKERMLTDKCARRRAGTLTDGYCGKTCGVCVVCRPCLLGEASPNGFAWDSAFHNWTMLWDQERVSMYVDEQPWTTFNVSDGDEAGEEKNPFRRPMHMFMTQALVPYLESAEVSLPISFLVDHVRVWQRPDRAPIQEVARVHDEQAGTRRGCGFPGITEDECRARSCSWDETMANFSACSHRLPGDADPSDAEIGVWRFSALAKESPSGCPEGQRNAKAKECLQAVQEAAAADGVEVSGMKTVDDAAYVPAGCSYGVTSQAAIFNTNKRGGSKVDYRAVCMQEEAETSLEQEMAGGRGPPPSTAPPRVYVLPLSKAWNEELLRCPPNDERWHPTEWGSEWPYTVDAVTGPLIGKDAEYDLEAWFYEAMRRYTGLTADPRQADLVYVPALIRRAESCVRSIDEHVALVDELGKAVGRHLDKHYTNQPNATLFAAVGSMCSDKGNRWDRSVQCNPLAGRELVTSRALHIMAWEQRPPSAHLDTPNIVVPHMTFTRKSQRELAMGILRLGRSRERRVLVLNTANAREHRNTCAMCGVCPCDDQEIAEATDGTNATCAPGCHNIRQKLLDITLKYEMMPKLVAHVIDGVGGNHVEPDALGPAYADATFCLQPGDDTATRAGFYQSIVYGCIPVVFSHESRVRLYAASLAFADVIPYSELWVHIPEAKVMAGEDIVEMLRNVSAEAIEARQELLRRFGPMLDFDCDYDHGCDPESGAMQAALTAALQSAARAGGRERALEPGEASPLANTLGGDDSRGDVQIDHTVDSMARGDRGSSIPFEKRLEAKEETEAGPVDTHAQRLQWVPNEPRI